MEFSEFYSKLTESGLEDINISLNSWHELQNFCDENSSLCVLYITTLLSSQDVDEHIKCLEMILFKNMHQKKNIYLEPNIRFDFQNSLLSLFETESLQLVSVASSIVFILNNAELKDESNPEIISVFADNLERSTNPYVVFGYCCLLFDICLSFSLSDEVNYLVVSAVFQQLSTKSLPPVVANRCIALFRSTVPNYSPEFKESQLFSDVLKSLVELTNQAETKTESLLAWAVIISTCKGFILEILNTIGEISISDLHCSEDVAVLIACCVFWTDTARAFAHETEHLLEYTEGLLRGLFRVMCIRPGDQLHEEFDELPQTATHTLKTFTKFTAGTTAPAIAEIVLECFESSNEELLSINATLIFSNVLTKAGICNDDVFNYVIELVYASIESRIPLLCYNALRCTKALVSVIRDDQRSYLERIVESVLELINTSEYVFDTSIKRQIASLMSVIVTAPYFNCQERAAEIVIELVHSPDTLVSAAAFAGLDNIGQEFESDEMLELHTAIVNELLDFLEKCINEGNQMDYINDISNVIGSYILSMQSNYAQFIEKTITLMVKVFEETHYVYRPLSYIAAMFPESFNNVIDDFLKILVNAISEGFDAQFCTATECIWIIGQSFNLDNLIPGIIESLCNVLNDSNKSFNVLKSATELIIQLNQANIEIPLGEMINTIPNLTEAFKLAYHDGDADYALIAARYLQFTAAVINNCEENRNIAIELGCELAEKACNLCNVYDSEFDASILIFLQTLVNFDPNIAQDLYNQNPIIKTVFSASFAFKQLHQLLNPLIETFNFNESCLNI